MILHNKIWDFIKIETYLNLVCRFSTGNITEGCKAKKATL